MTGWIMGRRPSNVERNRWVVSLLDLSPADRILEVGFGPGVALGELARLALVVAYLASTAPRSWSGNSLASRP